MAEENIFGIPDEPVDPEDVTAEGETFVEEATTSEAPEAEAPSEGPPAEEPLAAPEEEQVPELEGENVDPLAAEQEEEVPPTLFAGKFDSPEALEKGYNESREMWRRANEARKAEAQRALELQERYGQLYQQMEGVVPILEQAAQRERAYQQFAEQYKSQYGDYPQGYEPPAPQPAPGPVDVDRQIELRLQQERANWQAQQQARQEYEQLQGAIFGFYGDHPEVEPNGALDSEITDARDVLNNAWDRYGIEVDPSDRGSLEIMYEASRDPALLEVLKLNPSYFESAYGMQLARRDAAVISGRVPSSTEPITETVPRSQVKATGAKKPYVESAAIGSEAPEGEDENDPWVRIKNAGPVDNHNGDGSIFFE